MDTHHIMNTASCCSNQKFSTGSISISTPTKKVFIAEILPIVILFNNIQYAYYQSCGKLFSAPIINHNVMPVGLLLPRFNISVHLGMGFEFSRLLLSCFRQNF